MSNLLRFSEAAALALHAMARVAVAGGEAVSARSIAADCGASEAHMVKVCQRLARGGLLQARRGATGGFALARPAGQVRLLEIYTVIEGPVVLKPCLFQNHSCIGPRHQTCVVGTMVMGFEKNVLRYLKGTTLATVAAACRPKTGRREIRGEALRA